MKKSTKLALAGIVAAGAIAVVVSMNGQTPAAPATPAIQATPNAQQLAACQAGGDCPLGHAFTMQANIGQPTQYSYTVAADKVVTEPGNIVKVEFTIHGLTGTAGDDGADTAGSNASVETSIGKTRYAVTEDFNFDGAASGHTTTGWVTFNPLPDGVTAQAIQWNNQVIGPVTWVVDWSSGY
jgi:hypothetical protein